MMPTALPGRTVLKRVLIALAVLCLVVPPLIILYFVYLFDWNSARDRLSVVASEKAGRKIVIEDDIRLDWGWPISRLSIDGLAVDNVEGGSEPVMLELDRLEAAVDLRTLFRGDVEFTAIELTKPRLLLEKNAAGDTNWNFSANPAGAVALAPVPDNRAEFPIIGRLAIDDGRVTYRDPTTGTELTVRAATVRGEADDSEQRIEFDGDGLLQGQPFRFELVGGSVLDLREAAAPYPVSASIASGDTSARIAGTITDPIALKGLDVELAIRGGNAADLFPLTGIALLPTPPYDIEGRLLYNDEVWVFRDFSGRMGDSDLAGELTWDQRPQRPLLKASFTSRKLDLDDLGGFIGARPGSGPGETASAEQRAAAAAQKAAPRILPDVPLDISRLAAMDAEVELQGVKVITNKLPVDDFHARFHLHDRMLRVKPVRFGSGKGDIALQIAINARKEPVRIASTLELRRVPIKSMFDDAAEAVGQPNVAAGYIGGTADLAGTGKSLREMLGSADGTVGIGMEGGRLSQLIIEIIGLDAAESVGYLVSGDEPVPIRCVVGHFEVDGGLMRTRALVVDTEDTVVTGNGTIDLKDESMELMLEPEPKDFSPLSARAPLGIGGTLEDPVFTVKPAGLIARGAAAVALGILFPPAALLAFVEPGLGEDSQCKTLLAEMAAEHADPQKATRRVPKTPRRPGPG